MSNNIGDGFFLRFTEKETEQLFSALRQLGHPLNACGIKTFLMECITGEDAQGRDFNIEDFATRYAAQINAVKKYGPVLLREILKKKTGG